MHGVITRGPDTVCVETRLQGVITPSFRWVWGGFGERFTQTWVEGLGGGGAEGSADEWGGVGWGFGD